MSSSVFDGKYTVVRELGEGGMGKVLLVRDAHGTEHALKYCTASDTDTLRRFEREVRAMQVVKHPHVVPILDASVEHNPPYFVMPVAQSSLDKEVPMLAADHPRALASFVALCDGVAEVHRMLGPHRDLKPHNALRMSDGTVAVSDFGLIKIDPRDSTVITKTMQVLGTDLYMAPEQRIPGGSRDADHLVDVYALGATLYHIVTAKYPVVLDTAGLRPTLARIIRRATAPTPRDRYQTVAELATEVREYLALLQRPEDPQVTYGRALDTVVTRLAAHNQHSHDEMHALLVAVRGLLSSPSTLVDEFDRIPDAVLILAALHFSDELLDALEAYVAALNDVASGRPWSYGEQAGERMQVVFSYAQVPAVKRLATRATLIVAHDLNRFAAMDILEAILLAVTADADALEIANMLRDEAHRFKGQASRYQGANIHRFLLQVVMEVLAEP